MFFRGDDRVILGARGLGRRKAAGIVLLAILAVLLLGAGGMALFLSDAYEPLPEIGDYLSAGGAVAVSEIDDGFFLDGPGEGDALIFYPGAKVEAAAYIPLMYRLAEGGVDVFLIDMPCNVAVLGINRADDIPDTYNYEHWYIGGHSLGGAVSAIYAAKHPDDLDGLVLLAAYSTKDLRESKLRVLTVYGTEDGVLNRDKLRSDESLLPADAATVVIEGGNHAQFGCYGPQKGDGTPLISAEEQWEQTAEAVLEMIHPQ